jgi:hypothetical protein
MLRKNRSLLLLTAMLLASACMPIRFVQTDQGQTRTAEFDSLVETAVQAFRTETAIPLTSASNTPFPTLPTLDLPTQSPPTPAPPMSTSLPTDDPFQELTKEPALQPTESLSDEWKAILALMKAYGNVQQDYISGNYRSSLERRLEQYGSARNILTLELHGDNYNMYDGRYSLTPEVFYSQVDTLMSRDYHFATLHEVEGFTQGWFPLPARSVILTTDISSQTVIHSTPLHKRLRNLKRFMGINHICWSFHGPVLWLKDLALLVMGIVAGRRLTMPTPVVFSHLVRILPPILILER